MTPHSDDVVIIGGAESGVDAALALADAGCSVTVLDDDGTWQFRSPDPSEVLSPRTNQRLEAALADEQPIGLVAGVRADRIEQTADEDPTATTTILSTPSSRPMGTASTRRYRPCWRLGSTAV